MSDTYDAVVVGGGPAGLSAALWLARYRRRVVLVDANAPRNAATWAVHGYFGVPDPAPEELRERGRAQAAAAGAELEFGTVTRVSGREDDFRVELEDGRALSARRVLLATGLVDLKPEIPGFESFYGTSIWHCPDCDGPAITGKRVGVIGWGTSIARYCMYMLTWTDQLTLLTNGQPHRIKPEGLAALEEHGIPIRPEAIVRLEGEDGCVQRVVLRDGPDLEVDAIFFHVASGSGSPLAGELGCELFADDADEGILSVDRDMATSVPGIYAAGDITPGSRLVIRAASEGVRAAIGMHASLIPASRRI